MLEIKMRWDRGLHTCCADEDIESNLSHFILGHHTENAFHVLVVSKARVGLQI